MHAPITCIALSTALPSCTNHGDVRLFGGDTNFEGRVEICLSGSWVSICVNDCYYHHPVFCYLYGIYTWDSSDSAVFCRQLTGESYTCKLNLALDTSQNVSIVHSNEFCASLYTVTSLIFDASFTYQVRSFGPPYFTDPSCSGSEGQLLNCGHSTSSCTSTSTYGVGLRCYGKEQYLKVFSCMFTMSCSASKKGRTRPCTQSVMVGMHC